MYFKYKKGFTLTEIIVVVSIMSLLFTTVIYNYSTFNDNLAVSSAAQEMAVAIRQAQTFGLNVRESSVSSGRFDYAYGIYFDPQNNSGDYYVFVDRTDVPFGNGSSRNYKYDAGSGCGSVSTECVERFTLRNGVTITGVCDLSSCYNTKKLGVSFLRPNPDALIYFFNSDDVQYSGPVQTAKIQITSPKGKISYVTIENTGQVLIE